MLTCDVAVIGAGIVGAACAYELASSGLRVTVVEPNAVAAGGTNLGYGSLSILDESPELFVLTKYGLSLWEQFVDWLPLECEYHRCGTIWLALDEASLGPMKRRSELFNREGIHAELLDRSQINQAEPGLQTDLAGGLFVADDGCLRASRAAEFLLQLAEQKGAIQLRKKAIMLLEHEVRLDDGALLYAGNIVNAAGGDAAMLTPELPIEFSKGHILAVQSQTPCLHHQVSEIVASASHPEVHFEARQGETGEIWIGSSHQPANANASLQVEPKMVAQILRRAIEMVPGVAQAKPLRSWAGLRTATVDGLPLIGRAANKEGVFAATAHDGYGATTALATARLIADELLQRTPEIDPTPYLPDRLRGRS